MELRVHCIDFISAPLFDGHLLVKILLCMLRQCTSDIIDPNVGVVLLFSDFGPFATNMHILNTAIFAHLNLIAIDAETLKTNKILLQ